MTKELSADQVTNWGFHNPVRVLFGRGMRGALIDELAGSRCLIVTSSRGRKQLASDPLLGAFVQDERILWVDNVQSNPGLAALQADIDRMRGKPFDAIVAFGGGSAIDSAKVLAVALAPGFDNVPLRDLLANPSLHQGVRPKPLYAIPTTAGTGSEVTPFSTVWDHENRRKHSLAGSAVFPRMAIVDPALTDDLPVEITLSTGLDAINQAAESIWNRNLTPVAEAFATRSLKLGMTVLPHLMRHPGDVEARNAMAECSLLAGMAISQTRTALCHSMSYPITAHFNVPHGLACAFTMPAVLRLNLEHDDGRFVRLSANVLGAGAETIDLVQYFDEFNANLKVASRVQSMIRDLYQLRRLVPEMYAPGRADNNLAPVDALCIDRIICSSWNADSEQRETHSSQGGHS